MNQDYWYLDKVSSSVFLGQPRDIYIRLHENALISVSLDHFHQCFPIENNILKLGDPSGQLTSAQLMFWCSHVWGASLNVAQKFCENSQEEFLYILSEPIKKVYFRWKWFWVPETPWNQYPDVAALLLACFFQYMQKKMAAAVCRLKKLTSLLMVVLLCLKAHFFHLEKIRTFV